MPEVDFIDTQIAAEDTRSLAEKARDCVLVGAVEGLFFTAFLIALVIEGPVLVTGYLALMGFAAYGWTRFDRLDRWFKHLLRRNQRFAIVFLAFLLVLFPFV
ncbi:MAG: hypothetical protein O7E53_06645, partial [Alphaproteobacteria bacterium]|nr:hypothetical protein [Alphaproteobacteria bacterium]